MIWGAIEYKGEGVFIAGGAGVTLFIAILRQLQAENKTQQQIILLIRPQTISLKKRINDMLAKISSIH
jgi:predicted ferric reductase